MAELSRPRLQRAWSSGLLTSRSLGSLGEYDQVRSRPANTPEERAAKHDNDRRAKENGRSLRVEHTIVAGHDVRGKPTRPLKSGVCDEVLLRWASEPMARAIDAAFADSRLHSKVRAGVPPNLCYDHGPAPGDVVLQPVAMFEIHDPYSSAQYAHAKATIMRTAQRSGVDEPIQAATDTDVFYEACEQLGTGPADGPGVAAGPLQPDGPFHEKVLFHAAPAGDILEILYGGLFELAEASPERGHKVCTQCCCYHGTTIRHCVGDAAPDVRPALHADPRVLPPPLPRVQVFGPGHYFSDLVCTADKYAGDPRDARQVGSPGAVMTGHMRLTKQEAASVRFMLMYRVVLGPSPAKTSRRVPDPPDVPPLYHAYPNEGANTSNIFAPRSEGRRWNPPFTSLVASKEGAPSEFVVKHVARCLPVALVAYRHVPARGEQVAGRLDRWW